MLTDLEETDLFKGLGINFRRTYVPRERLRDFSWNFEMESMK